jgi:hypothetical protein
MSTARMAVVLGAASLLLATDLRAEILVGTVELRRRIDEQPEAFDQSVDDLVKLTLREASLR